MIGVYWIGNIVIGIAEIIIFIMIIGSTARSYARTHTGFTKTLSIFSGVMLLYSILVVSASIIFAYRYGSDVALPFLAINAVSAIGFTILLVLISE
ncbi:MAG: hypothetical protein QXO03_00340 [Thermoplasmatales archaeon]